MQIAQQQQHSSRVYFQIAEIHSCMGNACLLFVVRMRIDFKPANHSQANQTLACWIKRMTHTHSKFNKTHSWFNCITIEWRCGRDVLIGSQSLISVCYACVRHSCAMRVEIFFSDMSMTFEKCMLGAVLPKKIITKKFFWIHRSVLQRKSTIKRIIAGGNWQ